MVHLSGIAEDGGMRRSRRAPAVACGPGRQYTRVRRRRAYYRAAIDEAVRTNAPYLFWLQIVLAAAHGQLVACRQDACFMLR
jgi:hypothetical protein